MKSLNKRILIASGFFVALVVAFIFDQNKQGLLSVSETAHADIPNGTGTSTGSDTGGGGGGESGSNSSGSSSSPAGNDGSTSSC